MSFFEVFAKLNEPQGRVWPSFLVVVGKSGEAGQAFEPVAGFRHWFSQRKCCGLPIINRGRFVTPRKYGHTLKAQAGQDWLGKKEPLSYNLLVSPKEKKRT